ncbi:MAG TPA: tRNA lysidine(34) synthetase TilS [Polyangiaceae bacterium]|nr:tRNA lysidine(34) synthetase TilS [Polyangiaceae bacterium]
MSRSHPPTLTTLVRATLRLHGVLPRGATVLIAVSGGPDSMALLHVLAGLRRHAAYGLFAHGVDHGLREESGHELDVARDFAHSLDVPFERTRVRVAPGGNLQARARIARWNALREAAARAGASRIATGHHADDRAETFVMRLLRGAHACNLAVLPVREGDRIRPMIHARRSDIEAHVSRHTIPHALDPSNRDPRFLRTRVRYEILPVLERLGPRVVEHLCTIADELAAEPVEGVVATRGSATGAQAPRAARRDVAAGR